MLCALCDGAGNLICAQPSYSGSVDPKTKKWAPDRVQREWYECPACGGAGVRNQAGPAMIGPRRRTYAKPG